jgi:hypothetical protein
VAQKLIEVAQARGLHIGFDHVYGGAPLPESTPTQPATHQEA